MTCEKLPRLPSLTPAHDALLCRAIVNRTDLAVPSLPNRNTIDLSRPSIPDRTLPCLPRRTLPDTDQPDPPETSKPCLL